VSAPLVSFARHFADLPPERIGALVRLCELVREWNARINLISRKDIDHLEDHHVLHSLAAAKVWKPAAGATAIDLGSGGGFPGLPLAIVFPECRFTLVDFVGKKMKAVQEIADALELDNVRVVKERAENLPDRFDYVFGRAVAVLPQFLDWAMPLVQPGANGEPPNGAFYFKGSRYREELAGHPRQPAQVWPLQELFDDDDYFAEKYLLFFK
jgi:16S rRNA (guanine527-N7)-methyltransferase